MANRRRLDALTRYSSFILSSSNVVLKSKTLPFPFPLISDSLPLPDFPLSNSQHFSSEFPSFSSPRLQLCGCFSPTTRWYSTGKEKENGDGEDDEDEEEEEESDEEKGDIDDDDEEGGEGEEDQNNANVPTSNCVVERANLTAEEEKEAAAIGYKVIGPLDASDRPFKPWEPVFAVVQIGSHQFKVSNGDSIYTERLKHCNVNDKLILTRVLMLGSKTQTIIGRPILLDAAVHAVIEEHALDAKVIIFKKKRRKNYRRTKGHRQELTRLRITNIQGIEKPQKEAVAA